MPAIDYDELFDRLGDIGHIAYLLAGNQAAQPAELVALIAQYTGTADADLIGSIQATQAQIVQGVVSPIQQLTSLASTTLLRMVKASEPAVNSTAQAMAELIRQMRLDTESVDACTIGASVAALTGNTGIGAVVLSTKRGDGLVQENVVAETLRLTVTSDSYTGGQTAGQEPLQLAGTAQIAGLWDYNYPTGSGAAAGVTAISPDTDGSTTSNVLTNGDMEEWTGGTPALDNWVLDVGVWGTSIQQSTTEYRGSFALQFNAGATNNALYQTFGDSTLGTAATLTPLTSYAVNFWLRANAGTVSAGVLTVELVDGLGAVINDEQGTANSFTVTLSTLTTAWTAHNGTFRVPEVPPSTLRIQFRISTDLAGDNVLLDDAAMGRLTAAYPGGFGFAVFSGATPFVAGDGYTITTTNDRAGESYLATFQSLFDRLYNMRQLGLLLPSSGAPTQPDSKIVS